MMAVAAGHIDIYWYDFAFLTYHVENLPPWTGMLVVGHGMFA